jgi:hypothetical protein
VRECCLFGQHFEEIRLRRWQLAGSFVRAAFGGFAALCEERQDGCGNARRLRGFARVNAETPPLRGGVSGSAREPDDYLLSHG